jgi:hypothetical protein
MPSIRFIMDFYLLCAFKMEVKKKDIELFLLIFF